VHTANSQAELQLHRACPAGGALRGRAGGYLQKHHATSQSPKSFKPTTSTSRASEFFGPRAVSPRGGLTTGSTTSARQGDPTDWTHFGHASREGPGCEFSCESAAGGGRAKWSPDLTQSDRYVRRRALPKSKPAGPGVPQLTRGAQLNHSTRQGNGRGVILNIIKRCSPRILPDP
jgi:hypothetical protein